MHFASSLWSLQPGPMGTLQKCEWHCSSSTLPVIMQTHTPTNIQDAAQLVHNSHCPAKPHSDRHGHDNRVLHVAAPQPGIYSVSPSQAENTS